MVAMSEINFLDFMQFEESKAYQIVGVVFFCISSLAVGAVIGFLMPEAIALYSICVIDAVLISTMIYLFFMGFTGVWLILAITMTLMTIICLVLSFHFNT